jgi:crossover junction endodeoxyribonuclease RuvC
MIVLGIDPGTETTGFGVVAEEGGRCVAQAFGTIRTDRRLAAGSRLLSIHAAVVRLVEVHRPLLAVVERLYFKRNVTSALAVGQARGVVLLALAKAEVPVLEFSPPEIKVAVTGNGGADKDQVQHMVRLLLGLPDMPDDAADALAAALCGLFHSRVRQVPAP